MNLRFGGLGRVGFRVAVCTIVAALVAISVEAQNKPYERSFPQSKREVEKAIAGVQSGLSGHLPVLDGFAVAGESLDRYRRGFFQAEVQVDATASGGSVVRVTAKVTAWYADPAGAHSGYQLLPSNGRIESDVLDQIGEQLAAAPAKTGADTVAVNTPAALTPARPVTPPAKRIEPTSAPPVAQPRVSSNDSVISAPSPRFPETSTSLTQGLASSLEHPADKIDKNLAAANSALQTEVESLEEILKNQAHPKNLVAVKKSGTPVVSTPSLTAKPDFLASQHDEFELLNFNADWVHVRVSGLSRGWIWRNSVEMPEGIPDTQAAPPTALKPVEDLFHVAREENAQFPGDWEPLRSKNVKILTVQTDDTAPETSSKNTASDRTKERLDYTRFLLQKTYGEMAGNPQILAGIVVIFDSIDGGMIAAPLATLQQWKAGTLSDSALWHKCFFDPPALLDSDSAGPGQ